MFIQYCTSTPGVLTPGSKIDPEVHIGRATRRWVLRILGYQWTPKAGAEWLSGVPVALWRTVGGSYNQTTSGVPFSLELADCERAPCPSFLVAFSPVHSPCPLSGSGVLATAVVLFAPGNPTTMSAEPAPAHHAGRKPDLNPSKLSIEINRSTRDVHDSINKIIMVRVGLGLRDVRNFREGILSFFYIYKTFEEEWSRLLTNPPQTISARKLHILRTLHTPLLLRTEPLLRDLSFYYSLQTPHSALEKFSTPTTPARIAYANHIREAIKEEPLVIIAYAHNMYLALFAGGKIIKSKMLSQVRFFPRLEGMTSEESQRLGTNMFMWEVEEGKEEEIVKEEFKRRLASVEGEIEEKEREGVSAGLGVAGGLSFLWVRYLFSFMLVSYVFVCGLPRDAFLVGNARFDGLSSVFVNALEIGIGPHPFA
ncbi:heme oxygenase-like protein [Terfezia boudieri ATCC MYA-4762]|uniref:Heme oxygenase-like protein n=1 Tax=Terfezia boudieri ATCC MYA-4762 TaxID=1051890 RepID=A0A3N4M438_9PEZI|nr:heme oxygenase-like protein [Terfezia boudieri ATCC MYA-4762]